MSGWIKLHRSLLDWEWADCPDMVALWVQLLLRVNHEQRRYHGMVLEAGQILTDQHELARFSGLSRKRVRNCLENLKKGQQICVKSSNKYSIISITNWCHYQETMNDLGQQRASKGPAKGQPI